MLAREVVYGGLTREDNYAQGWSKGKKSLDNLVPDHMVSRRTGHAFTEMDWIVFAEKYLNEAKRAYSDFCPDIRTVHVRMLKAASLLVSGLQCNAEEVESISGISSNKFPLRQDGGGLQSFLKSDIKQDGV
jgi:hypothetical protein